MLLTSPEIPPLPSVSGRRHGVGRWEGALEFVSCAVVKLDFFFSSFLVGSSAMELVLPQIKMLAFAGDAWAGGDEVQTVDFLSDLSGGALAIDSSSSNSEPEQKSAVSCKTTFLSMRVSTERSCLLLILLLLILLLCFLPGVFCGRNEKKQQENTTVCSDKRTMLHSTVKFVTFQHIISRVFVYIEKPVEYPVNLKITMEVKRIIWEGKFNYSINLLASYCPIQSMTIHVLPSYRMGMTRESFSYKLLQLVVLLPSMCVESNLGFHYHAKTSNSEIYPLLVNYEIQVIVWRSGAKGEAEQKHPSLYCYMFQTFLEEALAEDAVPSPFGLYHQRKVRVPLLLVLRFNGKDRWSLSSVIIQYLQLRWIKPQMHMAERPPGEPPEGHQLASTFSEALEGSSCGCALDFSPDPPSGFFCYFPH